MSRGDAQASGNDARSRGRDTPGRCGVLLLAAGVSRRFGSDKRFSLLPDGRSLLAGCIDSVRASGLPLLVCLRGDERSLAATLADAGVHAVCCADAGRGMGHTLSCGIAACPADWQGAVIALADMPWVRPDTYMSIARALAPQRIVVPTCAGRRGNPVAFGRVYFADLAGCSGDQGARALLARHAAAVTEIAVDDPGIHRDVDTPAQLSAAIQGSGSGL